jgi:hypothetical protein
MTCVNAGHIFNYDHELILVFPWGETQVDRSILRLFPINMRPNSKSSDILP